MWLIAREAALGLALAAGLWPQFRNDPPAVRRGGGVIAQYGEAVLVPLHEVAEGQESMRKAHVVTRGQLELLNSAALAHVLTDGNARVLLIPGGGLSPHDLNRLLGYRVEVRGIVRPLRRKESVGGMDLDLVEDPELPSLPAPALELPRVSLTVLSVVDASEGPRAAGRAAAPLEVVIRQLRETPPGPEKPEVRVVGQFRGRNLFGDLPASSQRSPADWVLKDGEAALWVTGKAPRGKGWALDPGYKGDASRWLEVDGRAELVGDVVYVRASKVSLRRAPTPEPPP